MSTREDPLHSGSEGETDEAVVPFARRAPRISQPDVFRAADELLLEGHRPTIDRVRMRLGRGSPNTINDHLDAWWAKLGSRLRDVPGHEFPRLPERVAHALQHLWNEALEGAHETLRGTLLERERAILQREQGLETRTRELSGHEQAAAMRAAGLEESLGLIRDQLTAANRRAEILETALQDRDTECARLRRRIEVLEESSADLRGKLDAGIANHQAERTKLEDRYSTDQSRWLTEVDRARQFAKEAAKGHERQLKELRDQIGSLQSDRDHLKQELLDARSDLKGALEERLRSAATSGRNRRTVDSVRKPQKRRIQPRKVSSLSQRRP